MLFVLDNITLKKGKVKLTDTLEKRIFNQISLYEKRKAYRH
mgnify:CR=1 FL=1